MLHPVNCKLIWLLLQKKRRILELKSLCNNFVTERRYITDLFLCDVIWFLQGIHNCISHFTCTIRNMLALGAVEIVNFLYFYWSQHLFCLHFLQNSIVFYPWLYFFFLFSIKDKVFFNVWISPVALNTDGIFGIKNIHIIPWLKER